MSSSPRFTPPQSREQDASRQRSSTPQRQPSVNASPASSATASTTGNTLNLSRALDRPSLRLSGSLNLGTPVRKLIVRSDPSIVTCFDPADKELYDLWARKR
ncbi:hypothetical protein BC629DRAFT_978688 [Irpex lacteus]|nr:hypothetical protein BC629DRAFT_978688 [Irpex lacteus]